MMDNISINALKDAIDKLKKDSDKILTKEEFQKALNAYRKLRDIILPSIGTLITLEECVEQIWRDKMRDKYDFLNKGD